MRVSWLTSIIAMSLADLQRPRKRLNSQKQLRLPPNVNFLANLVPKRVGAAPLF